MKTKIVVACSFLGLMLGTYASAGVVNPQHKSPSMFEHGALAIIEYDHEHEIMMGCAIETRAQVEGKFPEGHAYRFVTTGPDGELIPVSRTEFITIGQNRCFLWRMDHFSEEDP